MNVDSMELRPIPDELMQKLQEQEKKMPQGFIPVPSELEKAATKVLAGKDSAVVSRTSGGKLSRWAASERKKRR